MGGVLLPADAVCRLSYPDKSYISVFLFDIRSTAVAITITRAAIAKYLTHKYLVSPT